MNQPSFDTHRPSIPWLILLPVLLLLGGCADVPDDPPDGSPGPSSRLRIARGDWDTGWFQTEVMAQLLRRLGYQTGEIQEMSDPEFFQAVAAGRVDFWADGWFPNNDAELEQVKDQVEVIGYVLRAGALQGYLIDRRTADRLGVGNLQDFSRQEVADAFDTDRDGRADLIGCPADWSCAEIIQHQLTSYGLSERVEQLQADYEAAMQEALARHQRGESIFFYTWTPNWTVGTLVPGRDVVWLEVPFASLPAAQREQEPRTSVAGVSGCAGDPCRMGWPPNDIRVVANRGFLEQNRRAARLFEVVEIPLADISAQNALLQAGENQPPDIERHASDWLNRNQALAETWLAHARQ